VTDIRQEFILLSDTLGVSMVVDLINHRKPEGATESTVFGPFHRDGAPEMPEGGNIAPTIPNPTIVTGRVLDLEGRPIAGASLDVWQADSTGRYDSQYEEAAELHMRGKFRSGQDGRFVVRTAFPVAYPIPTDGPVGQMLRATNRHPWRPAHVHFVVAADGYEPVTTHLFESTDKYLTSDTVFAVKPSLVCDFERHAARDEAAKRFSIEPPFYTAEFDFVLKPARR
jgi:catechol 1,2-dioxygenase